MISVRADISDLTRLINSITALVRVVGLATAVRLYREQIKRNAAQGLKADGSKIAGYSPEYAKRRQAAGRQIANVDFRFSGQMLDSIQLIGGKVLSVSAEYMEQATGLTQLKGEWLVDTDGTNQLIALTLAKAIEATR
jgi:hypothetical protein